MILVVDDDPSFLEKAEQILNRDRYVFFAGDSKRAIELAQNLDFSVVLVDLNLRGEDGLTLIRKLRESFPDLPIIAISEAFQGDALEKAELAGAVEVLRKPITKEWKPVVERIRATCQR